MNIGIYIYDDAEVLDFAGPHEVFSTAARLSDEAGIRVVLLSERGGTVHARGGFRVEADHDIHAHPALDLLLVSGGVHEPEMNRKVVQDWLCSCAVDVPLIASVCTGVFLLAAAGLLHSEQVTTHWVDREDLQKAFPALEVVPDRRWVDAGNRVTSGGISAGIDMSLYLLQRLCGAELALRTARQMEFDWMPAD